MKILITSDWYYPVVNGVVRSILNLKAGLKALGHEVRVLTLSNTSKSYKDGDVYYVGSLSAKKIYPQARISNLLADSHLEEIKAWGPDIIHSQCEFSSFIMAKRIEKDLRVPIVHTYHTVYEDYTHYFSPSKKAGRKFVAVATKNFSRLCTRIISPTKKTKMILLGYGIKRDMVDIIPTGIEIPDLYDRKILKKSTGMEGKSIVYLGRLGAEKNIEELMDYYDRLEDDSIMLYIVGGGPYLKALKKHAQGLSKDIVFTGMVDSSEVDRYYQAADIFITASTSETQGLTYYEALANGTPVLCRDDSVLDGVVVDDFNGYRYKSFEEFQDFVKRIFEDKALMEDLSYNARSHAEKNFSVETFAKACLDSYEKAKKEYKYESINIFKRL